MTDTSTRAAGRPLRIVEIETFGRGGLAHYAYNLSTALAQRGHDVTLVTASGYELDGRTTSPSGVRVMDIVGRLERRAGAWFRKVGALVDAFAVTRLVRRLRADVVHLHCTNQIALAYLILLRSTGIPVVFTAHVVTPHERSAVQDTIHRWTHRLSRLLIAHSDFDRNRLVEEGGVRPERVVVLPHGEYGFFAPETGLVDRTVARRELGIASDADVALFFGYIREYKGLDVLLESWPAVLASRPQARLLIAGDPVQLPPGRRQELERVATQVGAIHRLEYVPFSEVSRYFAASDVLVLPYRHVSQSGVLFLALALGLPVIATRVGALPEVLTDGESGLLVTPGSSAELARALSTLLGDAALRSRLAAGGRAVAAQYTWPSIAEGTESVFRSLIDRSIQRGA
jgi:glycosyltransferase involved in cell wall biosynthesis